nr:chromatin-remodeling ATPase INO80-like [Lytechinus pictus]
MVITGGNFKLDQLKPKEVVSLLLDDEDIEMKFRMKQSEKKSTDDKSQGKERKRKRDKDGESVKEVGKKVKSEIISDTANLSFDGDDSILSMDSSAPSPVSVVSLSLSLSYTF